jgi:hypothetical protein
VLVALASAGAIALGVASATATEAAGSAAASSHPLLGITGNVQRFKTQTGQDSSIRQAFLGWGQGQSYGAPFAQLFTLFGPIPMLHLGTGGTNRRETITPAEIASGRGDGYLLALNRAISTWGKALYVRPMGEMNNANAFYAGFNANGTPRDAAHAPARFREAFKRIYVILHGGTASAVNAKLRALGLPPVQGGEPLANPFPQLRIVWSPLASDNPRVPGNKAKEYFPGAAYVDVMGGDIYSEAAGDTAPWAGLEALFTAARANGKPFSVPEAGLNGVDNPAAVRHLCSFLKSHPATEMFAYYESKPGSPYDLASKPLSSAAYRQCITPLAGTFPSWAAANAPGGGAGLVSLKLTPRPAAGPEPLAVQFSIDAKLTVPIQQWLLVFDDGTEIGGAGPPPATVKHTYTKAGVYPATLIVFPFPPFTTANARYYTSADVTVGANTTPVVSIEPTPASGPVPLSVSFRIELDISGPVTSWELIFDDGKTRTGTGAPPHFAGHTFEVAGDYNVLLIVNQSGGRRFLSVAAVSAGGGGGGGPGQPATATKTGTVLVNGQPFTGGRIPFNSTVDVSKGTLLLETFAGTIKVYGNGVSAIFVLARGTDNGKPIVELRLTGGNFAVCQRKKSSASTKAATTVRQLWGDGKGKFRTKGRYSSATVRGTKWLTADRCDGTLTKVQRGVVEVNDVKLKKKVRVPAGKSYLAKP